MSKNKPISNLEELAIACKQPPKHENMQRWKRKTKSRFIKGIECQVCHIVGPLQILGNYYRIRHYEKLVNGKPTFTYHRNDKDYIQRILANLKANPNQSDLNKPDQNVKANADQTDSKPDQDTIIHDLNLRDSSLKPGKDYLFLRASAIRSRAFFMFSTELAKDKRRWPSPYFPKDVPGRTATPAVLSR